MSNELVEIPTEKWCKLRDMYSGHKNRTCSYNAIQIFINWIEKDPKFPVKIYSLNGDWESDGTYVAELRIYKQLFCNTLSEDCKRLVDALNCFDASEYHLIAGYQERLQPAIERHFLDTGLKKEQFEPVGTFWYHIAAEEALKFSTNPPQNITLKSLDETYAEQINSIWPHRFEGSVELVKVLIRFNKSVGLFENDKLVAWCLILPLGSLGLLHVEDSHKRKGLGSLAVRCMSKLLAENGVEVTAPVVFANVASRGMFEKLGFKVIDKVYWTSKPPIN